jgi:hypothetical protein
VLLVPELAAMTVPSESRSMSEIEPGAVRASGCQLPTASARIAPQNTKNTNNNLHAFTREAVWGSDIGKK